MARHPAGPLSLEAPDDWVGAATAKFSAPKATEESRGEGSTFRVTREPLAEAESVQERASRAMLRIAQKSLTTFELVESRDMKVGGRLAAYKRFRFGLRPRVEQTLVMVDPGADPERQVTVLSFIAPVEAAKEDGAVFEQMLGSIRFANRPAG